MRACYVSNRGQWQSDGSANAKGAPEGARKD